MKAWMWILIAVAILGAGAFLYFKTRKKTTIVATGDNLGLDTTPTSKVTTVSPLTNKQPAATTKNATDSPVAEVVAAMPASTPETNWLVAAQTVYTPTLDAAGVSASEIAQLAAITYTPQKAQAYTEQNWIWKVADAKMLESMGGWPASVALA